VASPSYQDLLDRIDALEAKTLSVGDLPLKALQSKLEQDWQPSASLLLGSKSVTAPMLAATLSDLGLKIVGGTANCLPTGPATADTSPTVVAHGLGAMPTSVAVTTNGGAFAAALSPRVLADATNLTIRVSSNATINFSVGVFWLAVLIG
jgi:hypothetical protein